jgi:hypothetical protein
LKHLRLAFTVLVLGAVVVGYCTRDSRSRSALSTFPPVPEPRFAAMPEEAGGATLRVRVVDGHGAPLAGVGVHARSGHAPFWGFSDADGRVELDGLEAGELEVFALAFRRPPSVTRLAPGDALHEIVLGAETPLFPTLPDVTRGTLAGMLVPAGSMQLAPLGYEVHLLPLAPATELGGPVPRRVTCGPAGEFALENLAHGRYRAVVVPAWGAGSLWPDLADPDHATVDHAGAGPARIQLAAGALEGRVLDDTDRPIEGALVLAALAGQSNRVWPPIVSEADGGFAVPDMPPGTFQLTVHAGEGEVAAEVRVSSGEVTRIALPPLRLRGPP